MCFDCVKFAVLMRCESLHNCESRHGCFKNNAVNTLHISLLSGCPLFKNMSRRRQRHSSGSEDDEPILNARASIPDRRYRPRVAPPLPPRDFRQVQSRFDLAFFAPFLAVLGISGAGDERLPPGMLDRMQLMRPEVVSGADKQHLIDATTIVCTHSGVDDVQCGICLQSLDQGEQLRMAQYVQQNQEIQCSLNSNSFRMCCHKFHDDCLIEWFKVLPNSFERVCTSHVPFSRRISTAPSVASSFLK